MLLDSLPSCFSTNSGALVKTSTPKMPQNMVTSIYQATICGTPTFVTLTWCATHSAAHHSLTVNIVDSFSLSIPLSPSSSSSSSSSSSAFSFFRTRPGSKTVALPANAHHRRCRRPHRLLWDFSRAHFPANSAEPDSGFYLAVVHEGRVEFLLGDLVHDLERRVGSGSGSPPLAAPTAESAVVLLSRREHVFGRRRYATRARFLGSTSHDIEVECSGGALRVKVDGAVGLVVKRLAWKFRGNEKIVVGGSEVEFYWDVFNWVSAGAGGGGHGLFVFQVGDGGVWPEMLGPEKKLMRKSSSMSPSMSPGNWSVMQWSEENSEGGRSFCSSSSGSSRSSSSSSSITPNYSGFSLLLYAWKTAD
ncbi:hypothetical protein H6P81_000923 [Aristolochia fimbriata]|uniref:Uncharacterized protein n=1 Tax=Aristolochia fimbriata TaxID=158543 RepID=A0AAV7F831_ARIFI|nr:hypothetical protein H6P81_000923 [Aristolochia fimbriata]